MDPDSQSAEWLDWCRRADRLGVAWLPTAELEELKAQVRRREQTMKVVSFVNGVWEISGELPHGIQYKNDKFWWGEEVQPECLGFLWDGATGGAEACNGCLFSTMCLEKMAKIQLPAAQAELGAAASLADLTKELDVTEQSTLLIMAYAANEPLPAPVEKRKKKPPQEVVKPVKRRRGRPKKKKEIMGSPELHAALSTIMKETLDPQQALFAQSATDGALPAGENADNAEAQGVESQEPWRSDVWQMRYRRERARSRLVSKLVPGMVLVVDRMGQRHTCEVKPYYYLYRGVMHPTLYSVTLVAAGTNERPKQKVAGKSRPEGTRTLCNWNAARFWGLAQNLSKA